MNSRPVRASQPTASARLKLWYRVYRSRMLAGYEYCRNCGHVGDERNPLTWGHLVPHAHGGSRTPGNLTILCSVCNTKQGPGYWDHLTPINKEPDFDEIIGDARAACHISLLGQRRSLW